MCRKFSVSMCVYGGDDPDWFSQAVNSLLNQTIKPSEIVLVVDGPVPQSLEEIVLKYADDPLFRIIRLEENCGHGIARRTGLENCSYELVALMDADDICAPDRFEKQLAAFAEHEDASVIGGQIAEFIEDEQSTIGYRIVPQENEQIKKELRKRCPMNQMTVMFKKEDVLRAGGYLDWYCNEDYYLWVRMHLAGMKFVNVPDILVHVRVGEDMYMRRGGWKYFSSELKLQNYMLEKHILGMGTYCVNVAKRFVVQVLLPNRLRGYVFRRFAREKTAL